MSCVRVFMKSLFLLSCWMLLAGCSGYSSTGGPGSNRPPRLQTNAPELGRLYQIDSLYLAPIQIDEESYRSASYPPDLYRQSADLARALLNIELAVEESQGDENHLVQSRADRVKLLADRARSQGAQGLLLIRGHRFGERVGSRVGIEKPAALAFSMELFQTNDILTPIWRASYSFQDQALSENLLKAGDRFSKNKQAGWGTAEAAYRQGLKEALSDLRSKRGAMYTGKG